MPRSSARPGAAVRLGLLAVGVLAALAAGRASAEDSVYSAYLTLVERSCTERDAALRALSRWSPDALEKAKAGLYECDGCRQAWPARFPLKPPAAVDLDCGCASPPWAAATVLHTLHAFTAGSAANNLFHLAFAGRLQENARDEAFRRRWYRVAGQGCLYRVNLEAARVLLREGLELFEAEPDLLVALGASYEVEEWHLSLRIRDQGLERFHRTTERLDQKAGLSQLRTNAADLYDKALTRDPGHREAHLRLGHVELQRGHTERGLAELRWVTEHAEESDLLYLAHLFTGREQERAGRHEAALASYRKALEADPRGQTASIATSHALHANGDPAAAAEVLERGLAARRRARARDAWWSYPEGSPGQLVDLLSELHEEVCR